MSDFGGYWPWWSEEVLNKPTAEEYRVFFCDSNGFYDPKNLDNRYWVMKVYGVDPQVPLPLNWRLINLTER